MQTPAAVALIILASTFTTAPQRLHLSSAVTSAVLLPR